MEVLDAMVVEIEDGIKKLNVARGSHVRTSRIEMNLAPCMDDAQDFIQKVLRFNDDRALLKRIFGGNCRRIVHLRALCSRVEFKVGADDNRRGCIRECDTVMHILREKGYETALLKAIAVEPDYAMAIEAMETLPGEEALDKVKRAVRATIEGVKLDQAGHVTEAVVTYSHARSVLRVAITVVRAAARFKELARLDAAHLEADAEALASHHTDVEQRISHLMSSFSEGDVPAVLAKNVKWPRPEENTQEQQEEGFLTRVLSTISCQANCLCARLSSS